MVQKATARTLFLAIAMCLPLVPTRRAVAQGAAAPVILVSPMTIGETGVQYANPAIAVGPDGRLTVVAEVGADKERRLAVADLSRDGWKRARDLPLALRGECCNPALTYDSSGTLHLLWSEKTAGRYAIRGARRLPGGAWQDDGVLSRSPQLDCGFPRVALDGRNGQVWATWQAGRATRYGIYLAWRDVASSFTVLDVTGPRSDHHNLYPQLFPETLYPLAWYEEDGTNFALRSFVLSDASDDFEVVSPLEFDRLDANQMPWLFQAPSGMLAGVWTDLVGDRVRVLLGIQGERTRGEGLVADRTDNGDAAQPCAVAAGEDTIALAWTSRRATGSAVHVGRVDSGARVGPSLSLALPPEGAYSRPQLAAGGSRVVHCVWFSDAARGGGGDLYYTSLRF